MFLKWGMYNCSGELPSGVKDSLKNGGVRCAEEVTETDIHTHTTHSHRHTHIYKPHTLTYIKHTHTSYQQSLIITQQQSLRQCHNGVTVFSVDWLQEQGEVLKVTYWLYSWERSKQTEWKTEIQSTGYDNKLQTVTDTHQDTLCFNCVQSLSDDCFDDSAVNSGPTKTIMKL